MCRNTVKYEKGRINTEGREKEGERDRWRKGGRHREREKDGGGIER